jgi:hypothetical protein
MTVPSSRNCKKSDAYKNAERNQEHPNQNAHQIIQITNQEASGDKSFTGEAAFLQSVTSSSKSKRPSNHPNHQPEGGIRRQIKGRSFPGMMGQTLLGQGGEEKVSPCRICLQTWTSIRSAPNSDVAVAVAAGVFGADACAIAVESSAAGRGKAMCAAGVANRWVGRGGAARD